MAMQVSRHQLALSRCLAPTKGAACTLARQLSWRRHAMPVVSPALLPLPPSLPIPAVIAISAGDMSTGCWSWNDDSGDVRDLLKSWLKLTK